MTQDDQLGAVSVVIVTGPDKVEQEANAGVEGSEKHSAEVMVSGSRSTRGSPYPYTAGLSAPRRVTGTRRKPGQFGPYVDGYRCRLLERTLTS